MYVEFSDTHLLLIQIVSSLMVCDLSIMFFCSTTSHNLTELKPKLLLKKLNDIVFHYFANTCRLTVSTLTWIPVRKETKSYGKVVISDI